MGVTDSFDPQQNIYGAAKLIGILMKDLIESYLCDLCTQERQ